MLFFARPSPSEIEQFIDRSKELPLSYQPTGIGRGFPRGFKVDEVCAVIGHGDIAFARAKQALISWQQFDLGWVELFPPHAPVETGTVVAVLIHHLGFWSLNGSRVVYVLHNESDAPAFGFAYGTLTNHAELGEEIFEVRFNGTTQEVTYGIRAVSKPRAAFAIAGYPVTRLLQSRFRRDSIAAMKRAVAG